MRVVGSSGALLLLSILAMHDRDLILNAQFIDGENIGSGRVVESVVESSLGGHGKEM